MKIIIPIVPTAQMRARHGVVNGFSRTYKDKMQAQRENALMALLAKFQPLEPMQGELLLGVKAYLPIPLSKPKKWKAAAETLWQSERIRRTGKTFKFVTFGGVERC